MRQMTPNTMTPSYSAPKLVRPTYGGLTFDPYTSLDEEAQASEQREINAGMRATLGAVNSTLRSQGGAIRGLEELMKRALPEIDRMVKVEKLKADSSAVERVFGELVKVKDQLEAIEDRSRGTLSMVEGKFDAALGQRALEALQRQQQQAEHEAAAREAVAAEVVRIASSIAVFSQAVDALRQDHKVNEPRMVGLERKSETAELQLADLKTSAERLLKGKAEAAVVEALREEQSEAAEAAQRRFAKMEEETRKLTAELGRRVGEKMERADAQRALDALAEQVARQASDLSSGHKRLTEAVNARVERAELASRSAIQTSEGEAAEARAEMQAQIDRLQLSIDSAASHAASQLKLHSTSSEREMADLRAQIDATGEAVEGINPVRAQLSTVANEVASLRAQGLATQGEVEGIINALAEVKPVTARITPLIPKITSQLQVVTDRLEQVEDQIQALGEGVRPASPAAAQRDREMSLMRATEAMRVRLEALEQRVNGEIAASARRDMVARSASDDASASASAAAAAARSAALTAADAAGGGTGGACGGGFKQAGPYGYDESASLAAASSLDAEGGGGDLRTELLAMRREQAAAREQIAALHAELHTLRGIGGATGGGASPRPGRPASPGGRFGQPGSPAGSAACGGLGAHGNPPVPPTSGFPTPYSAALVGSTLSAYDQSRLTDLEASQASAQTQARETEERMQQWSAAHAETIEVLLSQALTGRWVGVVGQSAAVMPNEGGGGGAGVAVVSWVHQAANTHSDCFRWAEGVTEIKVVEPGVYEVGLGLWPPCAGLMAELRVDGLPAVLIGGSHAAGEALGMPPAGLQGEAHRSAACGLCCVTMLSLTAGNRLVLVAENASVPVKAYLGLRKL